MALKMFKSTKAIDFDNDRQCWFHGNVNANWSSNAVPEKVVRLKYFSNIIAEIYAGGSPSLLPWVKLKTIERD